MYGDIIISITALICKENYSQENTSSLFTKLSQN